MSKTEDLTKSLATAKEASVVNGVCVVVGGGAGGTGTGSYFSPPVTILVFRFIFLSFQLVVGSNHPNLVSNSKIRWLM